MISNYLQKSLPNKFSKNVSRKHLYESVKAHLALVPPRSTALCIGSSGSITDIVKTYAIINTIQLDLLDNDLARNPDIVADICRNQLPPRHYDVVFMYEVLEHLYDPFAAIENIYNCLKVDGLLFGSAPFCLPMHEIPHDYFRYTEHGLRFLLRKFHNLQVVERGSYYDAIDTLWARTLQSKAPLKPTTISLLIVYITYFLKRPLSYALNKLNPLSNLCIGYVFKASKPVIPNTLK